MADVSYPTTARTLESPDLPPDFFGVRIATPRSPVSQGRVVLSGAYRIAEEAAQRIGPHLHAALVTVVSNPLRFQVTNPFKDVILFEDDEERTAVGRYGYFSFQSFEASQTPAGDYWAYVALGPFLSNVVTIRVG